MDTLTRMPNVEGFYEEILEDLQHMEINRIGAVGYHSTNTDSNGHLNVGLFSIVMDECQTMEYAGTEFEGINQCIMCMDKYTKPKMSKEVMKTNFGLTDEEIENGHKAVF